MKKNAQKTEILQAIRQAETFAVISHVRPDGDTLGANFGLTRALRALGKTVSQFCEDPLPQKFSYLPDFETFGKHQSETFDCVIAVDCGDLQRLGEYGSLMKQARKTINLDHHISNDYYAKLNYVEYYASTCQLILEFCKDLGVELDEGLATCLYTGLSTDTGNFMHSNTTEQEFRAAAELCRHIRDLGTLNTILYKEMPKARFELLRKALSSVRFFADNRLAILTVRLSDLQETGAEDSYTEGFVDYAINIAGVQVGIAILESKKNQFKISFRSKTSNVCKLAERFGGGGHEHASGCRICRYYEDAVDVLVRETEILLEEEEEARRKG